MFEGGLRFFSVSEGWIPTVVVVFRFEGCGVGGAADGGLWRWRAKVRNMGFKAYTWPALKAFLSAPRSYLTPSF